MSVRPRTNSYRPAASAIEALESRQLLTLIADGDWFGVIGQEGPPGVVNTGEESTSDVAVPADVQRWQDAIRKVLVAQADDQFGDLYGTTFEQPQGWFVYDIYDYPPDVLRLDGIANDAVVPPSTEVDAPTRDGDTNVQIDGVDEADIVETDGTWIYTIAGARDGHDELIILNAAEFEVASRTELAGSPIGMFLNGNRLTMISRLYDISPVNERAADGARVAFRRWQPRIVVTVLDVSDRMAPEVAQETVVDGDYVDARAVGDDVLLVVRNDGLVPWLPSIHYQCEPLPATPDGASDGVTPDGRNDRDDRSSVDTDGDSDADDVDDANVSDRLRDDIPNDKILRARSCTYETRDEYVARLDEYINSLTPPGTHRFTGDDAAPLERIESLAEVDVLSADGAWDYASSLTSVLKFDANSVEPGAVDSVSVRTSGTLTVHATAEHLHLVSYDSFARLAWPLAFAAEPALIDVTDGAANNVTDGDTDILPEPVDTSTIQRIDLSGDAMQVVAAGEVPGHVLNAFAIDEFAGDLRIATTTNRTADGEWTTENHLFVLRQTEDRLDIIGSVEHLAPTERIYSVRFSGDRAWIVTFRQVDPVFAIDLSDPANPQVTGELKIPGYSDYLQPIDDDHLLAIGRNADENGRFNELQISLFDVSDLTDPLLLHRYSFDGGRMAWSEATDDHHAFRYFADRQVLAIPVNTHQFWNWLDDRFDNAAIDGLAVLSIDVAAGIELVDVVEQPGDVRRSFAIDDVLFSISTEEVRAVSFDDLSDVVGVVALRDESAEMLHAAELRERYLAWLDASALDIEPIFARIGHELHLQAGLKRVRSEVLAGISFYHDVDRDGRFDAAIDRMLGRDEDGTDGWSIRAAADDLGSGAHDILAIADSRLSSISRVGTSSVEVLDADAPLYDFDGDDEMSALGDGILALRFMAGFTGDALTRDVINPRGRRADTESLMRYLNFTGADMLDLDGDGQINPLSDGIRLLRRLAGFKEELPPSATETVSSDETSTTIRAEPSDGAPATERQRPHAVLPTTAPSQTNDINFGSDAKTDEDDSSQSESTPPSVADTAAFADAQNTAHDNATAGAVTHASSRRDVISQEANRDPALIDALDQVFAGAFGELL